MTPESDNIKISDVLMCLDLLAYEAEINQQPNKEKLLYIAANLIRAGQVMRNEFDDIPNNFRSSIEARLKRALNNWDKITGNENYDT